MRKGTTLDLRIMIVVLFVFAISLFISVKLVTEVETEFENMNASFNMTPTNTVMDRGKSAILLFDYATVMFVVGFSAAFVISSFMVQSHPIFFIFSMLITAIMGVVASALSNAFWRFANHSAFSSVANQLPFTVEVMVNLPWLALVVGLMIAVALHGVRKGRVFGP